MANINIRNNRRLFLFLVAVCFISATLYLLSYSHKINHHKGENLLINGSFAEELNGWTFYKWQSEPDSITVSDNAAVLTADEYNHIGLRQVIQVRPRTVYHLVVWMQGTELDRQGEYGANVAINGTYIVRNVDLKSGEWQPVDLYFRTEHRQTNVTIAVNLGYHNSLARGTVRLKDVSLTEASKIPSGTSVFDVYTGRPGWEQGQPDIEKAADNIRDLLFACIGGWLLYAVYRWSLNNRWEMSRIVARRYIQVILLAGVVLRIILILGTEGFAIDIHDFAVWADRIRETGAAAFYHQDVFCDYPPGLFYLLWIGNSAAHLLGFTDNRSGIGLIILMLPAIIAEAGLAAAAYRYALERWNNRMGIAAAAVMTFLPAVLYGGAVWKQMDAVAVLAVISSFRLLEKRKPVWAAAVYGIAVITKSISLIAGPAFALCFIAYLYDSVESGMAPAIQRLKVLIRCIGAAAVSFLVIFLLSLPFKGDKPLGWLLEQYVDAGTSYPYMTVNAYNIFFLMGGNFQPEDALMPLINITYRTLGYVFILLLCAVMIYFGFCAHKRKRVNYYLLAGFFSAGVFIFAPRMHERYLYMALIFLVMAWIRSNNKELLKILLLFNISMVVNLSIVLTEPVQTGIIRLLQIMSAFGNIIGFVWLFFICYDVCVLGKDDAAEYEQATTEQPAAIVFSPPVIWDRKGIIFVTALTAVYAVIAFYNLGTTRVPQSYWRGRDQQITVDFGTEETISSVWIYSGISNGRIGFQSLETGEDNDAAGFMELNSDIMYRWRPYQFKTPVTGRQLLLAIEGEAWINELIFLNKNEIVITPAAVIAADSQMPVGGLFDEQYLKPSYPDAYNGMYFDELYHARTAYEHVQGMDAYESTHPPLGKILIAIGIWLFGMNPLGWRFIGTLTGVLMVPVFYMLAKRLLRQHKFACFATILFTFDFMHFTQTRIATIDTYAVFFIMLMYYFMLEYTQMSFFSDGLKKTLRPLGLCGLFFALGAASKWTCIYAGLGLAVLFFASLYKRWEEYAVAREQGLTRQSEYAMFSKNTFVTLSFCVGVFVVLPVLLYILSYLPFPFFDLADPLGTLKEIVQRQKRMFSYHSGQEDWHQYQSKWISWIFNERPIMYFLAGRNYLPAGMRAAINAFGNPVVWWGSLAGLAAMIIRGIRTRFHDSRAVFLTVAFASQLLPWTLISRSTYIYHYFGSVPFLVLALAYVLMQQYEADRRIRYVTTGLAVGAIVLFVIFYPVISAMPVPEWYAVWLRWLPRWNL